MTLSPGVLAMAALLRQQKDALRVGEEAAAIYCARSPFEKLHPELQAPFLRQAFQLEGAYLEAARAAESADLQARSAVFGESPVQTKGAA